jgi:hypothetical protein
MPLMAILGHSNGLRQWQPGALSLAFLRDRPAGCYIREISIKKQRKDSDAIYPGNTAFEFSCVGASWFVAYLEGPLSQWSHVANDGHA